MIFDLLGIPVAAALDRLRGDAAGPSKTVELMLYGLVISVLVHGLPVDWVSLTIAGLFALGGMPGWGEPMGAFIEGRMMREEDLEWWQFGSAKLYALDALHYRGLIWGLPACVVAPWEPAVLALPFAYAIAFPLSLDFAARLPWDTWKTSEWLRGGIGAALAYVGSILL